MRGGGGWDDEMHGCQARHVFPGSGQGPGNGAGVWRDGVPTSALATLEIVGEYDVATRLLYVPSSAALPEGVRRGSARPPELRDESYESQFDWDTFVYDGFHDDGVYHLIAPPLWGQDWRIDMAAAFGTVGADLLAMQWLDKSLRIKARLRPGSAVTTTMVVPFLQSNPVSLTIGTPARNDIFAGQRVLVTMSKDNEIAWIRDWIRFHVRVHGATGVLIYDNGSQRYTPQELLDGLSDLEVGAIVVVSWPFKYGPQGILKTNTHWDSNFCQHGGLEHARYFFLQKALSFLNCDVDELVVPADGRRSVFDEAEQRPGYVYFYGQWIEPLTIDGGKSPPIDQRRHRDFVLRKSDPEARFHGAHKYCVAMTRLTDAMQCATHRIVDAQHHGQYAFSDTPLSQEFVYRHFKAINTNWRWQRDWVQATALEGLEVDGALQRLMDLAIKC